MIWFFERESDRLHYEIHYQPDGHGYDLVITHPDGRREVERYADASALLERSSHLQRTLSAAGWEPPVPRPRHRLSA
jgi:hypothetical protein